MAATQVKRVAFFVRHFGERGTEVSVYNYADCNETILNNKSIILHFPKHIYQQNGYPYIDAVFDMFKSRFETIEVSTFADVNTVCAQHNIPYFYMQTAGGPEPPPFQAQITVPKFFVHCVFVTTHKFGDVYGPISDQINTKCGTQYPMLPYMIRIGDTLDNLREELKIPKGATVFGRYGGVKEFDIGYVKDVVVELAKENPTMYFLFMNTEQFCNHDNSLPNVIFLPRQLGLYEKRRFINTCDAFLHGREGGETFGLAVGEFAVAKKPIITTQGIYDNAHLEILKHDAILYTNKDTLKHILWSFEPGQHDMGQNGYLQYQPEPVMAKFNTIFLSDAL
jgi:hypothetical protein